MFVVENWNGSYNPVSGSPSSSASSNRTTGWKYDGLSQVTDLTAYNSNSTAQLTKYYYEDPYNASLVTHTVYPDSTSTPSSGTDLVKQEYNLDGSLKKQTDQRGVVHEYSYNSRRQLELDSVTSLGSSGVVDGAVRSIKRTYDVLGRLYEVYSYPNADGTGTELNGLTYNYHTPTGLPWRVYQHHGARDFATPTRIVAYRDSSVDGDGVFTNALRAPVLLYPNDAEFHSLYNDAGTYNGWVHDDSLSDRLGRTAFLGFKPAAAGAALQVAYKYNGTDRLVSTDYVVPDVKREMFNPSSVNDYDAFDRFGRTVRQQWSKYGSGAGARDQFDYAYDYAGNRLSRDIPVGLYATNNRDQAYAYDGLQRLATFDEGTLSGTSISGTPAREEDWTLDALGNWSGFVKKSGVTTTLNQTRQHNKANEIDVNDSHADGPGSSITASVGIDWADPRYDAAGNMLTMPEPSMLQEEYGLTYDAWNRLTSVTRLESDKLLATFQYDGLHRRIVKTTSASPPEIRHYFYNHDWQVVEERVGSDPATARVDAQYVWHPEYVDALAVRFWDHDDNPGTPLVPHYYLQDANYNVTAVTDNTGAVVERYAYTPYGEVTVLEPDFSADPDGISDIGNTHLYTGRERDPETGLQLNRRRFYASHLGRWLTRDPIEYHGGANLYGYVSGMPTFFADPTGLAPFREVLEGLCDKCCTDPTALADCKDRAKKIQKSMSATWRKNYGKGKNTSKHNVGGYLCWDWATAFYRIGERHCDKERDVWWVGRYRIRTESKTDNIVHFFARFCACAPPGGGKECCVDVDDGFIWAGQYCHEAGDLQNSPGWEPDPDQSVPPGRLQEMPIYDN